MRSNALIAGLVLAVAVTACSDSSGPREVLSNAEERWESSRALPYAFTAERSCFCSNEGRGPVRITVQNGAIASVVMVSTGAAVDASMWFTIDGLFDLIREQIQVLPSRLDAEFDSVLGYPTKVSYGTPENDGGGTIFVREFGFLGTRL